MTLPVDVRVYESDNETLVCSLTHNEDPAKARQVRGLEGTDVLAGVGQGTLAVDYDHPQVAELTGRRIIQVHTLDRVPLAFSIDRKREVLVPEDGDDAGRIVTVTGKTPRGVLRRGRVLPWLPVASEGVSDSRPITRRRLFNPASPTIDLDDWALVNEQARLDSAHIIQGWPSEDSQFVWGAEEELDMPLGSCWVGLDFTLASEAIVVFLVTADDQFVDYLHGAELQRQEPEFPAFVWQDIYVSAVKLQPGTYRYVVKGTNDSQKGAIRFEAWETSTGGITDQVFQSQFAGCKVLRYPEVGDAGYGHTIGHIFDTLLTECQARDELLDLAWDFTPTLDSNGEPWDDLIPEIDFDATGTVADAIDKVEDLRYCDVEVTTTGGLVLRLFNYGTRGETKPITISQPNKNLSYHVVETDFESVANDVLLVRDRGLYLADDDASVAADGRLPGGSLQVGPADSEDVLERIAAADLEGRTTPGVSVVAKTTPMTDFDAAPGDRCTVGDELLRVAKVGLELEPGGLLAATPGFSTPWDEARERADRALDRMIRESGGSSLASRIIDTGTNIPSGKLPRVKFPPWSWTTGDDLEEFYWDALSTEPVGWNVQPVEELSRIYRMIVKCAWAEPDGAGGLTQVSTGSSEFTLLIDGAPSSLVVTVPEDSGSSDPWITVQVDVYGPFQVGPGQDLSVSPTVNGRHVNGSVNVWTTRGV
jgi:hypothetical protein